MLRLDENLSQEWGNFLLPRNANTESLKIEFVIIFYFQET